MKVVLIGDLGPYKGIFWIVDKGTLWRNKGYCFKILCDLQGNSLDNLNAALGIAKSGDTYNHKASWAALPSFLTNNKPYNYYPRGRVEIRNGEAKIFLNGNINNNEVIDFIIDEFKLTENSGIKRVTVIEDNSKHYLCHLDDGYKKRIRSKYEKKR